MLDRKLVTKQQVVHGTSVINHAIRSVLKLTCSEYVFMDFIAKRKEDAFEQGTIYRNTGFSENDVQRLLSSLLKKEFLVIKNGNFEMTDKWSKGFPVIDDEFEEFWIVNSKAVWTGSKIKARKFYEELRKKYSRESIFYSRDHYLRYLDLENKSGFDRRIMAAERWLNPKNDYFLVDWYSQAQVLEEKLNPGKKTNGEKKAPLTYKQAMEAYAK